MMSRDKKTRLGTLVIEVLIIVIGVLVALAANSAMDQYRKGQSELEVLEALRRDIIENLNSLDHFWTPRLHDQVNARMRLQTFLSSSNPIADSLQFVRDVWLISIYATYDPNTASIEDLINTGRMGLIANKQLRYALLTHLNEIENIAEFDVIHRAYFLELSGRLGPKIIGGMALERSFLADYLDGDTRLARASASTALDANTIRSAGLLRELLVATATPFWIKQDRYKALQSHSEELLQLLDDTLANN